MAQRNGWHHEVVEASGIPNSRRLGKRVEVPEEKLAFVTEEAIQEVLEPSALNSGNIVDIYQSREDDFDDIQPLEVSYRLPNGRQVTETVWADCLGLPKGPRVCVGVHQVKAMHKAIAVLTRKVDNLHSTLRSCREHYYKELFSLRFGRAPEEEHEKYWFLPQAYEDNVTKELIRQRLGAETSAADKVVSQRGEAIQMLEKEIRDVRAQAEKSVRAAFQKPLDELFKHIISVNQMRKVSFIQQLLRIAKHDLNEAELKEFEDISSKDPEKERLKEKVRITELQVSELLAQVNALQEETQALKSSETSDRRDRPEEPIGKFVQKRGAVNALRQMTMRQALDDRHDRVQLVPEDRVFEMEEKAKAWEAEAKEISQRLSSTAKDAKSYKKKYEQAAKALDLAQKRVQDLESKHLEHAYMKGSYLLASTGEKESGTKSEVDRPSDQEAMVKLMHLAQQKGPRRAVQEADQQEKKKAARPRTPQATRSKLTSNPPLQQEKCEELDAKGGGIQIAASPALRHELTEHEPQHGLGGSNGESTAMQKSEQVTDSRHVQERQLQQQTQPQESQSARQHPQSEPGAEDSRVATPGLALHASEGVTRKMRPRSSPAASPGHHLRPCVLTSNSASVQTGAEVPVASSSPLEREPLAESSQPTVSSAETQPAISVVDCEPGHADQMPESLSPGQVLKECLDAARHTVSSGKGAEATPLSTLHQEEISSDLDAIDFMPFRQHSDMNSDAESASLSQKDAIPCTVASDTGAKIAALRHLSSEGVSKAHARAVSARVWFAKHNASFAQHHRHRPRVHRLHPGRWFAEQGHGGLSLRDAATILASGHEIPEDVHSDPHAAAQLKAVANSLYAAQAPCHRSRKPPP
eukprot:TRINITY_DN34872_c0_g1_i1.p1 TRINITY_DN34872_c0_g1~~TRINITY_DN34872_c0_g1_i1.p1  ORF type:complete len:868 (+),score=168.04 TRINITY_DN34872_c0_g1_i1:123-2726(+)